MATLCHWVCSRFSPLCLSVQRSDALAEVATRFLKKGSYIYLEGQLETRSWEKNGEKRYTTEVVLRPFSSDLRMLDKAPGVEPANG